MWTIRHIFDGDYGCEEPGPDDSPKVSVTLANEDGETRYVSVEDAWLTAQGLNEGDVWPSDITADTGTCDSPWLAGLKGSGSMPQP